MTRFYILAQDGAGAATIPFDEANLFARAIGLDLSSNEAKRILNRYQGENFIQLNPGVCFGNRQGSSSRNLKEQNPSSHRRAPE